MNQLCGRVPRARAGRCCCRAGQVRRLLLLVSALCLVPIVLLLVGSGLTRHRYQDPVVENWLVNDEMSQMLDGLYPSWSPSAAWMQRMEDRMAARRKEMYDACHRTGLDVPGKDHRHKPDPWEYLADREHHLVWCNVFKAASTSWMYNFNILAGYSPQFLKETNAVPLVLARKRYPRLSLEELREAMNSSISFMIVRHPLERLLSAYRDKMQNAIPNSHHDRLGAKILEKYKSSPQGIGLSKDPTRKRQTASRCPTFPVFVRYLQDEFKGHHDIDMHWTPIVDFCTPCQMKIDIIAKVDTLEDDQNFLIYKANLQEIIHPEWKNQAKNQAATSDVVKSYYSQLTQTQIKALYNIFRYDFELFGYTLEGYLDIAIKDSDETTTSKDKRKRSLDD